MQRNVKYPVAAPFASAVFDKFFPKDRVSTGALFRKMPYLLLALAEAWNLPDGKKPTDIVATSRICAHGELNNRCYQCEVDFSAKYPASANKPVLTFAVVDLEVTNMKQFEHTKLQVVQHFYRNHFTKLPCTELEVICKRSRGTAFYEARLLVPTEHGWWKPQTWTDLRSKLRSIDLRSTYSVNYKYYPWWVTFYKLAKSAFATDHPTYNLLTVRTMREE